MWKSEAISGLVDQIANALSAIHQQGIVHGKLNPSNILLDEEGNAYLTNFGITGELPDVVPSSDGDEMDETAHYASPEQVQGQPIMSAADVYSLGLIIFEAFAGESPSIGRGSQPSQEDGHLPPLSNFREDVPDSVDSVIQRATANEPAKRYRDVCVLADELQNALSIDRLDSHDARFGGEVEVNNPYKGLRPFYETDVDDFFGRDALVEKLLHRLNAGGIGGRFLALVGPSGSGKSSVIRAGLIPALRTGAVSGSEKWYVIQMLPGEHPLEELEVALLRIAVNPPDRLLHQMRDDTRGLSRAIKRSLPDDDSEVLLFIDQFEEVFTLVRDESERDHFLRSITAAVNEIHARLRVIITLRADFYDRPLLYPEFGELLHEHMQTVMPLSPAELEVAISGPANRVGVKLEPGLISEIVADVSDEPGALPLLQYALTELFENRREKVLASQTYQEIGGVAGALARRAEGVYLGLEETGRDAAKQLFLRLVTIGESGEATRSRVPQVEIEPLLGETRAVPEAFGQARLLSFDRDPATRDPTVEVAHEALVEQWPRLRRWMDENRVDLRFQGILAAAASDWRNSNQDRSYLLRGSRLEQFTGWAADTNVILNKDETAFLDASLKEREERREAEEARRQKELQAARKLAEAEQRRAETQTQSSNRFRRLAAGLGLVLIIALGATYFAFQQSRVAQAENRLAAARELAAASINNLDTNPELSILLAMQAISVTYDHDKFVTAEAENALHQAIQGSRVRNSLTGSGSFAFSGAQEFDFSGDALLVPQKDGRVIFFGASGWKSLFSIREHKGEVIGFNRNSGRIAVGNQNGEVGVWKLPLGPNPVLDPSNPSEEWYVFSAHSGEVTYVTFNNDGTLLATASNDKTAKVWDLLSGRELTTLEGHEGGVKAIAFHPTKSYLVTGSSDQTAKVWDLISGEEVRSLLGHSEYVVDVSFSQDGNLVATASKDGTAKLWDLSTGEELITLRGHSGAVNEVAFSPLGALLVTGGEDATVRVWETTSGQELLVLRGHNAPIYNIIFSPEAGYPLTTSSLDGTGKAWDIRPEGSRELLTFAGHSEVVFDIAYNQDGTRLASASWDGTVIIWSALTGSRLLTLDGHRAEVTAVDFTPNGERLISSSFDGSLKLWNSLDGEELLSIEAHPSKIHDVTFDLQGSRFASAGEDGTIKIWDAASGRELLSWAGGSRLINRLAFSPHGERIASAGADGTATIWDASTGEMLLRLSGHDAEVLNVSFSPDGGRLVSAGGDGLAKVWDSVTGMELLTLSGHRTSVWAAAFNPDGTRIATMSLDKSVKVWDAKTGDELLSLPNYNDGRDLAFSPNGKHLAVATGDGTVRVYVLSLEELMILAQQRVTRSLTNEECRRYLHLAECPARP
jgi:WD40 repeat protein